MASSSSMAKDIPPQSSSMDSSCFRPLLPSLERILLTPTNLSPISANSTLLMAIADSHTPNSLLCNPGARAAAGVIAVAYVCPLDVMKTRLQVHGLPQVANGNGKVVKIEQKVKLRG